MKNYKLSVIMPMYNSYKIENNLKEVTGSLSKINPNYEVIIVNDGSTNGCFEEARRFSRKNKKVKVVGYKKNKGKGSALKYGFNYVSGNYVTFLDCGGDLDTRQIKNFLAIMDAEHADIVIGSKKHPKSRVHYPLMRRIMSGVYRMINKILFGLDVNDTQVGLKLFKKALLNEVMPRIAIKRFAFDLELLVIANKLGYRIAEAPITLTYKFKSTIDIRAVFWMLLDTAAIFYRDRILKYYDKSPT